MYLYVVGKNGNLYVYSRQDCFVVVRVQLLQKSFRFSYSQKPLDCLYLYVYVLHFFDLMGQLHVAQPHVSAFWSAYIC